MNQEKFFNKIKLFIQELNPQNQINIDPNTKLIETKIVDSLLLTEIILFVEDITDNTIDIESFDVNSFSSIASIYDRYIK